MATVKPAPYESVIPSININNAWMSKLHKIFCAHYLWLSNDNVYKLKRKLFDKQSDTIPYWGSHKYPMCSPGLPRCVNVYNGNKLGTEGEGDVSHL